MKFLLIFVLLAVVVALVLRYFFWEKLSLASAYKAKYLGSHALHSDMPKERVLQALKRFPFPLFSVQVDQNNGKVTTSAMGLAKRHSNYYHVGSHNGYVVGRTANPGFFATRPDAAFSQVRTEAWPKGDDTNNSESTGWDKKGIQAAVHDMLNRAPGIHAILVSSSDTLLAEAYNPGVFQTSRLLGWSMTKTMANTMFGVLEKQGLVNRNDKAPVELWANDERSEITINDLLQMQSGLEWTEDYDNVTPVTRMLYFEEDMYQFAVNCPFEKKAMTKNDTGHPGFYRPGEHFEYSSGSSNILSGIMKTIIKNDETHLSYPGKHLFEPLGMDSALIELDATGRFVLSSYAWATARDWTRFGLLYLKKGRLVWKSDLYS